MTDSSGKPKSVDYDAATGTVQDKAAMQANSCDGQLAAALVQANDLAATARKEKDDALAKHGAALATIAGLEKDLEHTKTGLQKEIDGLLKIKESRDEVIRGEQEKASRELEATKTRAQTDYEALQEEKDAILAASQEEAAKTLKDLQEESSKSYESLKTEKDAAIADLRVKLKMSSEELEATMRSELEKAKLEKETKVAELTASHEESVAKLTKALETAIKEAEELLQDTKDEYENTIASLTEEMEIAAQKAAEVLETTKAEAKAFLKEQLVSVRSESDQAKAENEELLSAKNKKIQKMQEYTEQMLEKKAATEKALEEANAEIAHWRNLHAHRTYCNMTHITSDIYEASASVGRQASDAAKALYAESKKQAEVATGVALVRASDGWKESKHFLNVQVKEAWPAIQPYYEEHIASNYQAHLEPHLKQHVFPKVQQARGWFRTTVVPLASQVVGEIRQTYSSKVAPILRREYRAIVAIYAYYCNKYLSEFHKASKTSDILKEHPPPAYFLESWETSCANPQESMTALIHATLGLLALIFYRRLFGVVWWTVTCSVSRAVKLTPLRWIVPQRTAKTVELSEVEESESEMTPNVSKATLGSPDSATKETNGKIDEEEDEDNDEPVAAKLY